MLQQNLYRIAFGLVVLLLSSKLSSASVVIHFENFSIMNATGVTQNKTRIISFDTMHQKMMHYELSDSPGLVKELRGFLTQNNLIGAQDPELNYRLHYAVNGSITLERGLYAVVGVVSRMNYIIMCSQPSQTVGLGEFVYEPYLKTYVWTSRVIEEKTPIEISELVPQIKTREPAGHGFPIVDLSNPNLRMLGGLSNGDKGVLGELLTRLTLYTYNYRVLPSLYEGNHGLDGIFQSVSGNYLIITQSKAGDSNPRAPTVMKNELNEKHMLERLNRMKESNQPDVVNSANLVFAYLQNYPSQVYKMSHCLLDKGMAQVCMKAVDIAGFPVGAIKLYAAPDAKKIEVVSDSLSKFSPEPLGQLSIALASIPMVTIDRPQALRMFLLSLGVSETNIGNYQALLEKEQFGK